MNRRDLLRMGAAFSAFGGQAAAFAQFREARADVVIVGGGTGGCAAALSAADNGLRVIMTEVTGWIGGQFTSQCLSAPDEHPWIESFGRTRRYQEFRERIRDYYRRNYPLTPAARARWNLNPGNGRISALCAEPKAALAALYEMLAPHLASGRVTILLEHEAAGADMEADRVRSVSVRDLRTGASRTLHASWFVDATERGDLLPLTGTEYVTGAESRSETAELHAAGSPQPANMQAFTVCFAVDYLPAEDHTIDRPSEYAFWRDYIPKMRPAWPGKLLSLNVAHPRTLAPTGHRLDPGADYTDPGAGFRTANRSDLPLWQTIIWAYRRIIDRGNFAPGTLDGDISIINWPQNDYTLGNIVEVPEQEAQRHIARAKQLNLSLLYWLQTEAPGPGGKSGWKGIRLRPDVAGTADGMAKYPYVREARRIKAEFTVVEQHVGADARLKQTGVAREHLTAEQFPDSVGIGSYRIDLHPSSGGDNYIDVSSLPFQIPLGALLPRRVENLLPASKNIGTTHITNGCYRLHPVEWNIGESVGHLLGYCRATSVTPRQVRAQKLHLEALQKQLRNAHVELEWPAVGPR